MKDLKKTQAEVNQPDDENLNKVHTEKAVMESDFGLDDTLTDEPVLEKDYFTFNIQDIIRAVNEHEAAEAKDEAASELESDLQPQATNEQVSGQNQQPVLEKDASGSDAETNEQDVDQKQQPIPENETLGGQEEEFEFIPEEPEPRLESMQGAESVSEPVQPDSETAIESELSEPEPEPVSESDLQPDDEEPEADSQPVPMPKAELEYEPVPDLEFDAELAPEPVAPSMQKPELESEPVQELGFDAESEVSEAESEPEPESRPEPESEPEPEPDAESEVSETESETRPEADSESEPEHESEPEPESRTEPEAEPAPESDLQPPSAPESRKISGMIARLRGQDAGTKKLVIADIILAAVIIASIIGGLFAANALVDKANAAKQEKIAAVQENIKEVDLTEDLRAYAADEVLDQIKVPTYTLDELYALDLREKTGFTEEDLKIITTRGLKGCEKAFVEAEEKYGVNSIFLISIASLESAYGTQMFRPNNMFGYGRTGFSSKSECIMTVAKGLGTRYLQPGASLYGGSPTLKGVNKRYAANPQWYYKVGKYMQRYYNELAAAKNGNVEKFE